MFNSLIIAGKMLKDTAYLKIFKSHSLQTFSEHEECSIVCGLLMNIASAQPRCHGAALNFRAKKDVTISHRSLTIPTT